MEWIEGGKESGGSLHWKKEPAATVSLASLSLVSLSLCSSVFSRNVYARVLKSDPRGEERRFGRCGRESEREPDAADLTD